MKADIQNRFAANLSRVESLISVYDAEVGGRAGGAGARGRVSVATTDLLRAAVVFLHATIEDLVRSSLDWQLALASPEHLEKVPLVGSKKGGREPHFNLADLATHRGKTIDEVLRESVTAHLAESNYNNPGQLAAALTSLGVATAVLDPHRNKLGPMMARRHWIVHRADRNDLPGQGQYVARSMSPTTVRSWLAAVQAFGADFTSALP